MAIEIDTLAVIYPSAGTGARRKRAIQHSVGVLASCVATEKVIAALYAGQLAPPDVVGVAHRELRYAPYFAVGKGHSQAGTVPYTLKSIERMLIADGKASRYIRVAIALLEARELGVLEPDAFTNIAMLRPGWNITTLLKELKRKKAVYESLHGAEIALGIEPR
jgi:hypothetical protein